MNKHRRKSIFPSADDGKEKSSSEKKETIEKSTKNRKFFMFYF